MWAKLIKKKKNYIIDRGQLAVNLYTIDNALAEHKYYTSIISGDKEFTPKSVK